LFTPEALRLIPPPFWDPFLSYYTIRSFHGCEAKWLACNNSRLKSFRIPVPRGDWLLKPSRGAPFGLWYRDRDQPSATRNGSREMDRAEIRVFNRDGILTERRVVGGPVDEGE